jgi:hypothetical protein
MDAPSALTAGIRPADAVSGYMFFAFKPDLFLSPDAYWHEVSPRIDAIKTMPRQTGTAEIRIPGERSYATRHVLCARGSRSIGRSTMRWDGLPKETSITAVEGNAPQSVTVRPAAYAGGSVSHIQ